ncbi:MAG TPA: hypothetical protein DCY14_02810 [Anaerolineae bacterium]|nr:hypothetical protein [Anaerolineae bacterium]HRJ56890.1 restriction endonuclease subunit S [Anaerolineales bacterium]
MNGWQEVSLGSLLTRIKDEVLIQDFEKYQRLTIRTNNKGIEIRDELEGHLIGTKNQFVVHGGQFLLSKIDAMNGAFGIVPEHVENGIITSNFWAYDVDEEKLFSKYFNYLTHTRSFQEFCIQASSGTTHRKYLREDLFLGMEIPLPPLTEQRRIVTHIESLAARVNEAQSLREEADYEAEVISVSARNQVFGELQKNIEPVRFDSIADMRLGKMLSEKSKTGLNSKPYLRNANIQWDRLDLSSVYEMDFNEDEKPTFRLKAGDILVCEGGDIGKSAIWNDELPECYYQKALHRVRVDREKTMPRFILYHIFWAAEQGHFADLKTQTTIPHLTGVKLKAYNIYLPPLDEQRRIVAYLDGLQAKVNALQELQSQSQEELDALLPSVLDRAFKGGL